MPGAYFEIVVDGEELGRARSEVHCICVENLDDLLEIRQFVRPSVVSELSQYGDVRPLLQSSQAGDDQAVVVAVTAEERTSAG